jgi:hypothetical protein
MYNKTKGLFIHIPKTAGTSIGKLEFVEINKRRPHISSLNMLKAIGLQEWENRFTFSFVRNPFDRMASTYHYFINMKSGHEWYVGKNIGISELLKKYPTFQEFCLDFKRLKLAKDRHFLPQWNWVCDESRNVLVKFVGRYETLERDVNTAAGMVGYRNKILLPHENRSVHEDYRNYYNKQCIEVVLNLYSFDFSIFGYSKNL